MLDWIHDRITLQKYFFDDAHAYTEDFVLVHNLAIRKVSQDVNTILVHEYAIKNYGSVVDCNVLNERNADIPTDGFICFHDPKDAALMLKKVHHRHGSETFFVGPLFSWQQPNPHLAVHPLRKPNPDGEAQQHQQSGRGEEARIEVDVAPYISQLNLLNVNDDCLESILDFLPLVDKIQFARTCKRFLEVFQNRVAYRYRTLFLRDLEKLSLWQLGHFINFCGERVENLTISRELSFMNKYGVDTVILGCPNVLTLTVKGSNDRTILHHRLWHTDSKIRELIFVDFYFRWNENYLACIDRLKHLETLILNRSHCPIGFDFREVSSSLRKLYLLNCNFIEPEMFVLALRNMRNLTVLDIRGNYWFTELVFEEITQSCRSLEKLGIRCISIGESNSIANLICLKDLLLEITSDASERNQFRTSLISGFLNHLVQSHSGKLETLQIDGGVVLCEPPAEIGMIGNLINLKKLYFDCSYDFRDVHMLEFKKLINLEELRLVFCTTISIYGFLDLLMSCTKLKYVNISGCSQFIKNGIPRIVVLLKNQFKAGERERKLHLRLSSFADNDTDIENYLSTCDYKSVLKIVHESEASNYGYCFRK